MQTCAFCEPDAGASVADGRGEGLGLSVIAALRALHGPAHVMRSAELHRGLARAELDGEISEFWALTMRAVLATSEQSEFVTDYLDMAESVASSVHEHAVVEETRAICECLQTHPATASEGLRAALLHDCQAVALWNRLAVALRRLGEVEILRRELLDPRAA